MQAILKKNNGSLEMEKGADWHRQERILASKHVGATILTPLKNSIELISTGNRNFAMAA